jgi:hypothetical protein
MSRLQKYVFSGFFGSAAALIEPGAGMSVDHRALLHQEIASEAGSGINLCCDPKVS